MNKLRALVALFRNGGLMKRIVILSVALLLLIQLCVQMLIRESIQSSVELNLQHQLQSDAKIWGRLVDQNAQRLHLAASLLASDFGFRAAVSSGDIQTIASALENHGARIGVKVAALLDSKFVLQSIVKADPGQLDAPTVVEQARLLSQSGQQGRLAMIHGRLHQFVVVPVRAPLVIGWVVMGFAVDQSLADDMHALSSAHIVIANKPATGPLTQVYASLPNIDLASLSALKPSGSRTPTSSDYASLRVPTESTGDEIYVILLRSSTEALESFKWFKGMLLIIDAIAVLLFVAGISVMAARISKPLQKLVMASERMGRGDYSRAIPDQGLRDEVGTLARSFDRMRKNIQASQQEIRALAFWDRLTGLPNREYLRERLQSHIAQRGSTPPPVCVVFFDIDRFKHINDVMGYPRGDQVLQSVGKRLLQFSEQRPCTVARVGGDKFALLLPGLDVLAAMEVVSAWVPVLEEPLSILGQSVDISAGIGIACWPDHAASADDLLGRAEIAMYTAKRRNGGIQVYQPSLEEGSAQNLSLLSQLRHAIDHGELRLYLQPKINLANGQVHSAEGLVRWLHPSRGLLQPASFIPFAEHTGFVRFLTMWMLEEAARHWHALQPGLGMLRLAINLSVRDLMDLEFPAKVAELLSKYGVPHDGFCLEISESAIMDDPLLAQSILAQLSASGFKLSIDDFGIGYSSLAYLKSLPVNELKIDRSFVMGMHTNARDATIVQSTIDLAHNLGMTVVAEGVENTRDYDLLMELKSDEVQGFCISKPMPHTEFDAWRKRWTDAGSQTLVAAAAS